jgi:chromosome segregation ATPase
MTKQKQRGEADDDERAAEVEALQAAAADAEARAATARGELAAARERLSGLEVEVLEAQSARDSALGELSQVRSQLREAAVKYRAARLAGAPEVPDDLVPEAEDLEEVDRRFESAQRIVGRLRERLQEEGRSKRTPAGAPVRRSPDVSALTAAEKIKLGLQQAAERGGG